MAESVHYHMELMIPELKDLEEKGIFSKAEIKSIVKKRESYEYSLKRRAPIKQDYLKYIEYEMLLDSLRVKRKKKLAIEGKATVSDYASVTRIQSIFERALKKFYGDKQLWMDYIQFLKKLGAKKLAKVFGRAMQFHPREPAFWCVAAEYNWEVLGNASAARALFQRGLRFNQDSQQLWLAYFKMEMLFLAKVLARRTVLGIEDQAMADSAGFLEGAVPKTVLKFAAEKITDGEFLEKLAQIAKELEDMEFMKPIVENLEGEVSKIKAG